MTIPLKPIESRRLYQLIADQIRALIQRGDFPAGTRLPPERDLAAKLGVSRPSLREALVALEIDGSVEIRMGSGVYACAQTVPAAAQTSSLGDSPTELMAARAAVEGAIVTQAAARVTPEMLIKLREHLDAMRADIESRRVPTINDRLFHVTIAEIAGNSVLARVVGDLFEERHSPLTERLRVRSENDASWSIALAEHEAIYEALEARDPLAAAAAMRTHLKASSDRWVGD